MDAGRESMYTNGEYLANNPSWGSEDSEWKAVFINTLLKRNGLVPHSVAEVGCGFGGVLFHLSKLNPAIGQLHGFDISPQAIGQAKQLESDKLTFYLDDFTERPAGNYDLVLVVDVIEHLENYIEFLRKINSAGTAFIFHIPLDLSCRTLLKPHVTLQQRTSVGHLHYFSKDHVEWFLRDAGYKIKDWLYTFPEVDREKPRSIKAAVKKVLRKFSFFLSKDLSAKIWGGYSMMILAVKENE